MYASQDRTTSFYGYRITRWEVAVGMWPEACPLWVISRHMRCNKPIPLWANSGHHERNKEGRPTEAAFLILNLFNRSLLNCGLDRVRAGRAFELTSERPVLLSHPVRQLYQYALRDGFGLNCYGAEMVRLDSLTFSGGPFGSPFFLIAAKMSALGRGHSGLKT
jgi:hypothetical protein